MTPDGFRKLALTLPEAEESAHMGHPDFRVRGKIFATLGPGEKWGMVKLNPDQQASVIEADPNGFEPVSGAWGRGGATRVILGKAKKSVVREAMTAAWRNTAPKKLVDSFDADEEP